MDMTRKMGENSPQAYEKEAGKHNVFVANQWSHEKDTEWEAED